MSNSDHGGGVIDELHPDETTIETKPRASMARNAARLAELCKDEESFRAADPNELKELLWMARERIILKPAPKERKTRPLPTRSIKQRIEAALELGLHVTDILPDGTIKFDGVGDQNAAQDDPKDLRRLL